MEENKMTRHIHADLLHALAEDASLKFEYYSTCMDKWAKASVPGFDNNLKYRVYDPYRQFKEALAEGKMVQLLCYGGVWKDRENGDFGCSPDRYRIKPDPVVTINTQAVTHGLSTLGRVQCTWHDDVLVKVEVVK
jgi:hypothetical protein